MSGLFGSKPKTPDLIKQPERIDQGEDTTRESVLKKLAKRKRATLLNQITGEAKISSNKLGAA